MSEPLSMQKAFTTLIKSPDKCISFNIDNELIMSKIKLFVLQQYIL